MIRHTPTGRLKAARRLALVASVLGLLTVIPSGAASRESLRCGEFAATIVGTAGDDKISGTLGRDVIAALGGDDVVAAQGGNDVVCGGGGDDQLIGMGGRDVLRGQRGTDSLFGHRGSGGDDGSPDVLLGGAGPDHINYADCPEFSRLCPEPDGGDDRINGGRGNDRIAACDDGQNSIRGGRGSDGAVFCSAVTADLGQRTAQFDSGARLQLLGIEDLFGSPWATDTLVGDDGNNHIYTGFDGDQSRGVPDEVSGGDGNDSLWFGDRDSVAGGSGKDMFFDGIPSDDRGFAALDGGAGADRFLLCYGSTPTQPLDGADYIISGGGGRDQIRFGLAGSADLALGTALCADFSATFSGVEVLHGGPHEDTLRGNAGDNRITGGAGDDVLDGRDGDDALDGGTGTDECTSGEIVKNCESSTQ